MEFRTLDQRIKKLHEHNDVCERLDELQDAVALLRQRQEQQAAQWQVVCVEQRQHCSDLASMYQQLQALLGGSWGAGWERCCTGAASAPPTAPAAPEVSLKIEVRDLLLNFKTYIERQAASTNQRLNNMQKTMDDIRFAMEDDGRLRAQLEERISQLERQSRELLQRVSSSPWIRDTEQLQSTMEQQLQSAQKELADSMQLRWASISDKIEMYEARHRDEEEVRRSAMLQTIEEAVQQMQGRLESVREELVARAATTDANAHHLEERMRCHMDATLKDHVTKTCEDIRELQGELSCKHLRLVEDTMDAVENIAQVADGLPRKVALLQEDVAIIRESLQRHGEVLNEQCLQGSLQGAFDEVKDWLQDLEQRMLSRGEFDEVMAGIDDKLAELKREFIIRSPIAHAVGDESEGQVDGDGSDADVEGRCVGSRKR